MMKKILLTAAAFLLIPAMLAGCGKPQAEMPIETEPSSVSTEPTIESAEAPTEAPATEPATEPAKETTPPETEEDEDDAASSDINEVYAQQIERYYTAISQQWDEMTYLDHEMSTLAAYYYEGNPLDNIGFTFMDLDADGIQEFIIGAILNADRDPLVFEIWTLRDNAPVMLAQSGSHNRYYLQYAEEDELWSVAYEAENGAANHAVYYLQLDGGEFNVIQGVVFDAVANENDPWFMAYDLDWDVSNDIPLDEETAIAVMEAGKNIYAAAEYVSYSQYQ